MRRVCGFSLANRIDITVRMKKNVLSYFGHVERMIDVRMAKNIYDRKGAVIEIEGPRWTFDGMYEEVDNSGRDERGIQRP